MLSFSLPLDEYNDGDPERHQVWINGEPATVLVDTMLVTIDPDGRKDVRAILSESTGDGLITFVCSDSVSGAEYTVEIEPEPTPEEKVEM